MRPRDEDSLEALRSHGYHTVNPTTEEVNPPSVARLIGSALALGLINVAQGATYALGALLVWDWFFR